MKPWGHRQFARVLRAVIVLSLVSALPAQAQQTGSIRGQVVHATTGQPLASAQVFVRGTDLGVLTNADGNYMIVNVPAGEQTIRVENIGYAAVSETVTIEAGATATVNFEMSETAISLDELVVTGVTEATRRANVPFSVGQVSSDQMPVASLEAVSSLQGRMAGVNVVASSRPGVSDNIMLRTPTSAFRSNQPLFVVDGVILTESDVDISSLDVESIEVVKGAAAASLYGSRAASGVVQIRTVRGDAHPEGETVFRVRSEYGSSSIANPIGWAKYHNFQMNDQGDFVDSGGNVVPDRMLAATTKYGFQDQEYPGKVYDNIGALFNPGNSQSHQVSLGYNAGGTSWHGTVGHQSNAGVVRGHDGYKRTDVRLNVDHRPREDLSVAVTAFHMRSTRDNLPGNTFFDFIQLAPDVDLLQPDEDGTPFMFQPDPEGIRVNPLYRIHTQTNESERGRTLAGVDLRYHPVDWLSMDVNASYDRSDREGFQWVPRGVKTSDRPDGDDGSSQRTSGLTDGFNASLGFTATQDIGKFTTRTAVRGLLEEENNRSITASGTNMAVGGIPDLSVNQTVSIGSSESTIISRGAFLSTELDYDERYILNALVRRDGSSLFGADERWHNYYRISGAYRMASEEWWPFDDVSEFRLRYSRGTAGGRPNFADRFEVFTVGSGGTLSLSTLGNRELKPEQTTEQELGLDVMAFDKLAIEIVYAQQETVDQLINVPLPSMFGYSSQWQNAGTVSGNTIEAHARYNVIDTPGLAWQVGLIADRSRNRIDEFDRPCFTDVNQYWCAGEQIGTMWGQAWASEFDHVANHHGAGSAGAFDVNDDGLLVAVGDGNTWRDGVAKDLWGSTVTVDGIDYDWGMPIMRLDDDGQRALHQIGNGNPDLNLGFSNTLSWGGLTVYGLLEAQIGGNVYNRTKQRMYQWGRSADEDQMGKPDAEKKPFSYYIDLYDVNRRNSWFVEDASFMRLRELALTYRLDPNRLDILQRMGMDHVTLSLIGRNLFYWTDYTGYDPSVGSAMNRDDNFAYPSYRTLTASIDIQF